MSDDSGGAFARRIIALTDEMRNKEDAKHVKRSDKIKKKLAIEPKTAEVVKLIFKLFLEGDGIEGPLEVKQIAKWLNTRRHKTPTGKTFYTSLVHNKRGIRISFSAFCKEILMCGECFNQKNGPVTFEPVFIYKPLCAVARSGSDTVWS